ncbi:DUF3800 domain-containing protein [Candidatus Saccharibacteria bacterium]|nr:DUF3800 domain-containing protein [Candidatus Saccharibacteria bacterium]MCB9817447.1 DUF3800 domain-containing protein [Candidatus Nomurabacteria bacterium]
MNKQLVFIDDSGDPGFKLGKGSSSHFVIACVIFDDTLDAEETALAIKKFRREIGWADEREFKFNKTKKSIVLQLLQKVSQSKFRVRAICIDKSLIRSHELKSKQDSFYNYAIKEVLSKTTDLNAANIRLDGHSGRNYKKSATAYFRREINSSSQKIAKVRFVDSKTNNLIQLADLTAGAILRSTQTGKTDSLDYLKILEKRIENVWYFK